MKVGTDSLYSIISVRVTQCQFPQPNAYFAHLSTHWGRVTHICVTRLTTIGSVNGLSPGRRQAIIWTNAGILLIVPLWSLMKFYSKFRYFNWRKPNWKCSLENGDHFISAPMFYRNPTNPNFHSTFSKHLTHWGRDKMDAISQTTFSNAFSWMKMHEFRLRFHWSLFLRLELTIFQLWFR